MDSWTFGSCIFAAVLELLLGSKAVDLIRWQVLSHTGNSFIDREVCTAAVVCKTFDRPRTESRQEIVLCVAFHCPKHESEDSFEDMEKAAKVESLQSKGQVGPGKQTLVGNGVSFLQRGLDILRYTAIKDSIFRSPIVGVYSFPNAAL
jgi:hypothetical protein